MPLVLADRVRDTTTTTGTGTVTLSGTAPTGYQNFSVIGNGNTTYYTINAGSQWEVGIGTYSSTGPTLARTTVLESSNANALVDFAAGTKDVFVTYPADKSVNYDESNNVGIGTTSPQKKLVVSDSGNIGFEVSPNDAAQGYTRLLNYNRTTNVYTPVRYEGSTQTWFVGTAGTTRAMDITSAGNVGIGTTSPAAQFVVSNAGAAGVEINPTGGVGGGATVATYNRSTAAHTTLTTYSSAMTWYVGAAGTTRAMDLTSAGNLGIGRAAPAAKLDVQGTDGVSGIIVRDSATTNIFDVVPIASNGALVRVFDNAAVSRVQFTAYGVSYFNAGNVGIGTTSPAAKLDILGTTSDQLRLRTAATEEYRIGRNASTGLLDFYGSQTGFTGYVFGGIDGERMRITATGRVGIGTASPTTQLEVYGGASGTFTSVAVGNAATALQLAVDTSNNAQIRTAQSVNMQFFTASTERMRITSGGLVQINTTSGSGWLNVNSSDGAPSLRLTNSSTSNPYIEFAGGSFIQSVGTSNDLRLNGIGGTIFQTASVERMRILSTGEVGVNTVAPGTTFEVALSTSGSPGLRASRSGAQTQYIQMDIGGGASARLFATGGNKAMYIINNNSGAGLGTATDSTFIQVPGPTANTPITAMYIESSTANVGIGTTAPAGRVHATNTYTNTSNTNFIADGNIPGLNLRPANGRFSLLASYAAANTSSIVLGTGTANPSTEAMRFDHSTGNVGIGVAPTSRLHVSGTVNFTGALTSGDLADAVGYKGLPQNAQTSGYTLALADMGKHISITTGNITIPANGSVAFPVGATIVVYNNSGSTQTISITTDTLRQAGTANTGTRTLAVYGLATLVKVASTTWVVTGNVT